jgi:hypothetical protein
VAAIFNGSTKFFATYTGNSAIEFGQFCHHHILYSLPKAKIFQSEELRRLLETEQTFVFGVDLPDHFTAFRHDVPFFSVRSEAFRLLGFNLTAGYYAYRGVDRNLVLIPDTKLGKYREYLKTPLVSIGAANFSERPFAGGFVIDVENETNSEGQMKIMRQIASQFQRFSIGPIIGNKGAELAVDGNFSKVEGPLFVVWKDSLTTVPWIWNGTDIYNETLLHGRLEQLEQKFFPSAAEAEL